MARLVYSSGGGDLRDGQERSGGGEIRPLEAHDVRVRRDRSGRKGKTVTLCGPWFRGQDELKRRLKAWKQRCGSGGALKPAADARAGKGGADLEIQGDHVETILELLASEGIRAKRSGG